MKWDSEGGAYLKLRIEVSDDFEEDEVIIRCAQMNDDIQRIQAYIRNLVSPKLVFYKGQQEYYLPLDEILFFETDCQQVYAHTVNDAFKVRHRLYELEDMLPRAFSRAAKGTIVNTARIYAISRNLTSTSQIKFTNTHKQVYVSRHYYKTLKDKMSERSV